MTIEYRVRDLEGRIEEVRRKVRDCVRELLVDDGGRYLIAERLPALGSAIVPAVRELLGDPSIPAEVRCLAGLAGLEVGDTAQSASVLLEELERQGELAPLAARRLASARIPGTGKAVERALRGTLLEDVDSIVAYLDALRDLGVALDEDERRRLEGGGWQITSALAEWHPTQGPKP